MNQIFQKIRPPSAKPLFFRLGFSTNNPGNCYTLVAHEPVIACGDGTVVNIRAVGAAWQTLTPQQISYEISLDHGETLISKVHGIRTPTVYKGQQVTRGQIIGYPVTADIFFQTVYQNQIFNPNTINRHFAVQSGQFAPGTGGYVRPAPDLIPRSYGTGITSELVADTQTGSGVRYFIQNQSEVLPYLIDIAFNGNDTKTGLAATGVSSKDYWNNVPAVALVSSTGTFPCSGTAYSVNPFVPLDDYTGRLSTAWLQRLVASSIAGSGAAFDPMLAQWEGGWIGAAPVQNEFQINGLPPGKYLVYAYANQSSGTNTSNFYLSTSTQAQQLQSLLATALPYWIQGGNFVVFSVGLVDNDYIAFNSLGFLSGMQIQMISSGFNPVPTAEIVVEANPAQGGILSINEVNAPQGHPATGFYEVSSQVEIGVVANPGYTFTGWLDLPSSASVLERIITVPPGGATYTAVLVQTAQSAQISVSVSPPQAGSVSGGGEYEVGNTATIQTFPNVGWNFTGWSNGPVSLSQNIIVPSGGGSYVANFVYNPGTGIIAVQCSPANAGIATGGGAYSVGAPVQINAIPNPNWVFTGWSDGASADPRTIYVPAGGATYVANFVYNPGTAIISVSANPPQGGTVSGGGAYTVGNAATIQAYAANGWQFTGWNDGTSLNPRQVAVPVGGATYVANFTAIPETGQIILLASPSNAGIVSGGGNFLAGSSTPISAIANSDWVWSSWSDGGAQSHDVLVPDGSETFTAYFVASTNSYPANPVFTGVGFSPDPTYGPVYNNLGNLVPQAYGNGSLSTGWYRLLYLFGAISWDNGQNWYVSKYLPNGSFQYGPVFYYWSTSGQVVVNLFPTIPGGPPVDGNNGVGGFSTIDALNAAYGASFLETGPPGIGQIVLMGPNAVSFDFYYVDTSTADGGTPLAWGMGMYMAGPDPTPGVPFQGGLIPSMVSPSQANPTDYRTDPLKFALLKISSG